MGLKHYLTFLLISSCYFYAAAQKKKAGTWELSGGATQFHYSSLGQRTGGGLMTEYYLTNKISVRGGIVGSGDYLKISPAPLFWASLFDESPRSHHHIGHSKNPLLGYLLCFTLSDGFAYNIKLHNNLYFSPYIAPLQMQFFGPRQGTIDDGVLVSSIGAGFKGYINKRWVCYAGGEFSKSFLFKDGGYGYSFNASIGYVFKKK